MTSSDCGSAGQRFFAPISKRGPLDDVVQRYCESSISDHSAADELDGIVCAQVPAAGRAVPFPVIAVHDFEPDRVQRFQLSLELRRVAGLFAETGDGFQTGIVG